MPDTRQQLAEAADSVNRGELHRAAALCKAIIGREPANPFARHIFGVALRQKGEPDAAIRELLEATRIEPANAAMHFELGVTRLQLKQRLDALAAFEACLAVDPRFIPARINAAALYEQAGELGRATEHLQRVLSQEPTNATAHFNLGNVLRTRGEVDRAAAHFELARQHQPDWPNATWNASLCHLLLGNYASGWPFYEARAASGEVKIDAYPQPRWRGEALKGRTLLIHAEQGVGDEIMFASCLPQTIAAAAPHGDGRVVLVCEPRLAGLFARSFPSLHVIGAKRPDHHRGIELHEKVDLQIPMGSLPALFRTNEGAFPHAWKFLVPDAAQVVSWREQFDSLGRGLKIGIAWQAGKEPLARRIRTMSLAAWEPVLANAGCQFINLQYGDTTGERKQVENELGIEVHHFAAADPLKDLDAFAAKLAAVDLVITAGNATAHLAGALGVPAWVLLPHVPSWRWRMAGDTSPWYGSVRLYRQQADAAWDPVIAQVAADLQARSTPNTGVETAPTKQLRPRKTSTTKPASKPTPTHAEIMSRAATLYNEEQLAEAVPLCETVLAEDPKNVIALRITAVAARRAGEFTRCEEKLRTAVEVTPKEPALHFELGVVLLEQHRLKDAMLAFEHVIALNAAFQPAYVNLSAIHEQQERYDIVVGYARKAIELKPTCSLSMYNLANALRELGEIEEAIEWYHRAIALNPTYGKSQWNLAMCQLLSGNFAAGWPLYEKRTDVKEVEVDDYPYPRWQGESLAGKTILIHAEQGLGDEVLFSSCFNEVIARAEQVVLVCEPRLAAIFQRSFPTCIIHGHLRRKDRAGMKLREEIDFQIPAGSLPLHFRNTPQSFGDGRPFLKPSKERVEQWRERFAALGPGMKIGIAWQAGGKPQERRKRNIPLAAWKHLLTLPGVKFVNLQYGDTCEEVAEVESQLGIKLHDWEEGDPLVDVDGFTAKIAALDMVISVGNATVHFAGAIGTPTLALLPRIPSWRWGFAGEKNPWYGSVTLLRQTRRENWTEVLLTAENRVRAKLGLPTASRETNAASTDVSDRWFDVTEVHSAAMIASVDTNIATAQEHFAAGRLAEAEDCLRKALNVTPRHYIALHLLGQIAHRTKRLPLAIRSLQRSLGAIEAMPVHHLSLGLALIDAGRVSEARTHLERACKLDPTFSAARLELAKLLAASDEHALALPHFDFLATTSHDCARLRVLHGVSLGRLGQIDAAKLAFLAALKHEPTHVPALAGLGDLHAHQRNWLEAMAVLSRAAALDDKNLGVLCALATAQQQAGKYTAARVTCQRVIALGRADLVREKIAAMDLCEGRLVEGWAGMLPHAANNSALGESELLIVGTGALVDDVMLASCYGELTAEGPQTTIYCHPRLQSLFARSFTKASVVAMSPGASPTQAGATDRLIHAASIPAQRRTTQASFSPGKTYLMPHHATVHRYRQALRTGGAPVVGIALESALKQHLPKMDGAVTLPLPADDHARGIASLDDLAAQIKAVDLLIASPGLVAHLGGALGVPTWVLVTEHADWRLLPHGDESLWYSSVRLYRSYAWRNGAEVFRRMAVDLLNRLAMPVEDSKSEGLLGPHFKVPARVGLVLEMEPQATSFGTSTG